MRCALFGKPIQHSFSPCLHQAIARFLQVPCTYDLLEQQPTRATLMQFDGCNITIPYKESVCSIVDCLDPIARAIGAVNVVWRKENVLYGSNTDWIGVQKLIVPNTCLDSVLLIGTGGAARAVRYALAKRTKRWIIAYRNRHFPSEDTHIPMHAIPNVLPEVRTVIQATPVSVVDASTLYPEQRMYDLRSHESFSHPQVINGRAMLVAQALASWPFWMQRAPQYTLQTIFPKVWKEVFEL